ncbi:cytochrome P450 [Amycolatopsis japonica]|uniref:cytochrome P450 n=1 Tax=Amycolatopsis japonica TaxID=208439 RepID=UPI00366AD953
MTRLPFSPELDLATEFNRLREQSPVARVTVPSDDSMWLVSRHSDVRTVYTDPRFSRDMTDPGCPRLVSGADYSANPLSMVNMEGAAHRERRRPVAAHLTPRRIEALRAPTEALAERLVSEMDSGNQPVDFVESFAMPLPAISSALVAGVPEQDYGFFRSDVWALPLPDQYSQAEVERATALVYQYTSRLAELRTAEPGQDMTSALLDEVAAGRFPAAHLPVVLMEVMFAGMLNTRSVLCSALLVLLRNPDWFRALAADDDFTAAFTEEALRCFPHPITGLPRLALADVELSGVLIREGEAVLPALVAANRDPEVFPDPDVFDPFRTTAGHLTFGHGAHHCIGSALARMQLHVAFTVLARRLPDLRLSVPEEELAWRSTLLDHCVTSLPLSWNTTQA